MVYAACVAAHILVGILSAVIAWQSSDDTAIRLAFGILLVLPLALSVRGLWRRQITTLRWLSLLLVLLVGVGVVEVLASNRGSIESALLGSALLELSLVLILLRHPHPTTAPGSTAP
jgi:uncharacterized membrane protein